MTTYIFFRAGGWYPVKLRDDQAAIENVHANPGTIRVEHIDGRLVWPLPEHKQ